MRAGVQPLFYIFPSLVPLLILIRPGNKPHSNILDPQGPVPRKTRDFEPQIRTTEAPKKVKMDLWEDRERRDRCEP